MSRPSSRKSSFQCFKAKIKKPHAATVRLRVAALPDRLKLEKRECSVRILSEFKALIMTM